MANTPAIILKSKFVMAQDKIFSSYVDYVDRSEAVRNKHYKDYNAVSFAEYHVYMENPEKSTGLFTAVNDSLNDDQKNELKSQFNQAQKNKAVMWQDVISFDNNFLIRNGIIDARDNSINEDRIKFAVRESVSEMLKNEGLEASAIWAAAVHYNTDNLHVHITITEPNPTRPFQTFKTRSGSEFEARKGTRSFTSLGKMRSRMANLISERSVELERLSYLIRDRIGDPTISIKRNSDFQMMRLYNNIYQSLPDDLRLAKYNNTAMTSLRPKINELVTLYIQQNHKEKFREFETILEKQTDYYRDIYGDGEKEKGRTEFFSKGKMNELYSRLGNSLLKEMVQEKRKEQQEEYGKNNQADWNPEKAFRPFGGIRKKDLNRIKKILDDEFQSTLNKRKFEEMKREEQIDR